MFYYNTLANKIDWTTSSADANGWYKMRVAGKVCFWWKDMSIQKTIAGGTWGSETISQPPTALNKMYIGIANAFPSDHAIKTDAEVSGSIMTTGVSHTISVSYGNLYTGQVTSMLYCKAIIIGEES